MKIGVFDSGVGGKSVTQAIEKALPEHQVIFMNDVAHLPYGLKPPDEILSYVVPIFEELIKQGCKVIVVACNTVSTTLIDRLRKRFDTPLIAMEPMVKPAAELTKSNVIAICATPTTLASKRYEWLKETYTEGIKVVEPDCSDWTQLIENNQMSEQRLTQEIEPALAAGADVIVLGCTHYHWIEEDINKLAAGRAIVLQPEQPVIGQLKQVLGRLA
jgi:glutamate racemase